jgi:hypothetical protein
MLTSFWGVSHFIHVSFCADVGRLAIGICYDIRFPEMAMLYAARGMFPQHCSRVFFRTYRIPAIYYNPGSLITLLNVQGHTSYAIQQHST